MLSAQVLVPTLPSLLHCSTVGMQARSKARSVSIMRDSIIPACVIPFYNKQKKIERKKHAPSGVSLERTNPHSGVDWMQHAGGFGSNVAAKFLFNTF